MADNMFGEVPLDFQPEMQNISQQQKLSQMLLQQGMQQPQGQLVSGHYVKPSILQQMTPLFAAYAGTKGMETAENKQLELAKAIRQEGITEAQAINNEIQKNGPHAAYIQALRGRTPVSQSMAVALQKRLTEGPKWEKAVMPMADGSEKHGWVDYNSPDVKGSFVEGGTKPAYNSLEAAKFTYDTGMQPPSGAPVQPNRPIQPNAPVQSAQPMNNRVVGNPTMASSAMPLSSQTSNQPITSTGNAVPVSAMNRPAMSPKQQGEANQAIYTKSEEGRQADLKALPGAIEQANLAIKTIDEMIGDARLNDKGEVVYQKYDPVTKKWVEGKQAHGGFENYVGATMFPGLRFIEGTDTASFEPLYKSIKGQAFLDAFQRLKGGGQITELEGQKATEALLKLDKAQNEKDFIKYAREFQENLQRGMELAKNKAGVSKEYRSPVNQPTLRWNPQTNSWVNQ